MSLKNKKVLVTLGPTWVPLDKVRVLSNISSGETGQKIITALRAKGANVTALQGPVVASAGQPARHTYKFCYFDELKSLLQGHLKKNYAAVIHAAAVADFRIKDPYNRKISSSRIPDKLTLVKTEKLIHMIKKLRPKTYLVGFKLEATSDPKALKRKAETLIKEARCDLVVANSLEHKYQALIVNKEGDMVARATSRLDASRQLANILNKDL